MTTSPSTSTNHGTSAASNSEPSGPRPGPGPGPASQATEAGSIDLSVVLVAARKPGDIQTTLSYLTRQSVADKIEVLLVGPENGFFEGAFDEMRPRFAAWRQLSTDQPIDNVDCASLIGLQAARAPVVATVEDHAYPHPKWAESILQTHAAGDWAAVGSAIHNANPHSPLSWANQLMAYGRYTEPITSGQVEMVSRHNASFNTARLRSLGDELPSLLTRGGGLIETLQQRTGRLCISGEAKVWHVNPSRLGSTLTLRVLGGRLAAGKRAARENWPAWKRAVYVVGSPLIPVMRLRPIAHKLWQHRPQAHRLYPAVIFGASLDALGQGLGFALGPGDAQERLAAFEHDRNRHLTARDRRALEADACGS